MLAGRGVSFEPGLRGVIGRYACRHPDHQAFRHAERTFAASLARGFVLPSGSPLRALLYLPDLLWSGKVQCRLRARRQVTQMIDRRSSLLLDKSLMCDAQASPEMNGE